MGIPEKEREKGMEEIFERTRTKNFPKLMLDLKTKTKKPPTDPGSSENTLWMIKLCQCTFISCNNCTILMGDIDNGGGYACVQVGGEWELSVLSAQFCCEPKTALKMKVYLIKIMESIILKIRSIPINLMNKTKMVTIIFFLI